MREDSGSKYMWCGAAASGGAGQMMFSTIDSAYRFFPTGWTSASGFMPFPEVWDQFEPYGQPGGFLAFSLRGDTEWLTFLNTKNGTVNHHPPETSGRVLTLEDPTGGLRVLFANGILKAYGPTGETRWSLPLSFNTPLKALAVDALGNTLVLAAPGEPSSSGTFPLAQGFWVDASGQVGTPFLAQAPESVNHGASYELIARAEGGFFLGVADRSPKLWMTFEPLQTQPQPGPTWLKKHEQRPLSRLPNGKGYIRWGRTAACQNEAEFFSVSGRSCGKTRFPAIASIEHGNANICGDMRLGPDGTVLEKLPLETTYYDMENPVRSHNCRVRWWPALFQ
ncbi:MAG: hypothetical protein ABW123_02405 [Cystobacter sp.]